MKECNYPGHGRDYCQLVPQDGDDMPDCIACWLTGEIEASECKYYGNPVARASNKEDQ